MRGTGFILTTLALLAGFACEDPAGPYVTADRVGRVRVDFAANPARWTADPMVIDSARVQGDVLEVFVTHGGGCANHEYAAVAWNGWLESIPVQVGLFVAHEDHNDACDALLTPRLRFDLTPLKEAYRRDYRSGSGQLVLRITEASNISGGGLRVTWTF